MYFHPLALTAVLLCQEPADSCLPQPGALELTGRLIVQPLPDADAAARALLGEAILEVAPEVREMRVQVPAGRADLEFAAELAATGLFAYAHPDWLCFPVGTPNDPLYVSQWHHVKMQSEAAWDWITDTSSVIFANTDTGVDLAHPDLAASLVSGFNSASDLEQSQGGLVNDINGHGTATAGCAAAIGNNGVGTAGVGWNMKLMPIRVTNNPNGSAALWDIDQGARWAAENGARVVSTSFTGVRASSNDTTGAYLRTLGALWVWGIDNSNMAYPAGQPNLTVVVGTDQNDLRWSSSSWGHLGDCSAPCVDIWYTTNGGGWGSGSGTSFAAPLVAGVLGTMFAANPFLTAADCEERMFRACDDLGAAGDDNVFGRGRVNLERAVLEAIGGTLTLAVTNLVAGQTATFDFTGAQPGATVWIAYSTTGTGITQVPQISVSLALAAPAPLASQFADAAGAGSLALAVPASVQGMAVWFQAVETGNGSPFVAAVVQ